MAGLFSHRCRRDRGRVGPVILLAGVLALQLAPAPASAAGGTLAVDNQRVPEPAAGGSRALVFTVTLDRTDTDPVRVDYATLDGTATAGTDYVATSGTLDFGSAATTRTVTVTVLGDRLHEADETFVLRLGNASTGQTQLDATATILDDDPPPRLSVGDTRQREGRAGPSDAVFTVSLSEPSGEPVSVDYTTIDGAGPGGATAPADYAVTAGHLVFEPGEQAKPVAVPLVADGLDELDETFSLALTNPSGAGVGTDSATGTIVDEDGPPVLSVADATAAEGAGKLTFTVSIDRPSSRTVTFRVATADGSGPNGAGSPGDYTAVPSTPVEIPAGETAVAVDVALTDDQLHEATETLTLGLSEANAALGRAVAVGTITDDDAGSDLAVEDTSVPEGTLVGQSLVFTVRLSAPAGTPVTVDYATADGTAVAEPAAPDRPDYRRAAGTLTFQPAQTTKTVTVFVDHDHRPEGDETVLLRLSNPSPGVPIARAVGVGTITDDDGPADELVVNDIGFAEGDTGTAAHLFTVTRIRRTGGAALPVTVRFATGGGSGSSATAGVDYAPRSGVLVFAGPITVRTISLSVTGDDVDEDDETVTVTLSQPTNAVLGKATGTATIRDDDGPPVVWVAPATVAEGHGGAGRGEALVVLSSPSSRPVTVDYAVGGGTAGPGDYVPDSPAGTLTFAPGETAKPIGFSVAGDTLDEPDETFEVTLTNPVGVRLGNAGPAGGPRPAEPPAPATGIVTITDDDDPPAVSVTDALITETDAAARPLEFTIVLDSASAFPVTVTVSTADGPSPSPAPAAAGDPSPEGAAAEPSPGGATGGSSPGGATSPADYTAVVGRTVTIPAGVRAATVPVPVTDDHDVDSAPAEAFTVSLSSPVAAVVAGGDATGTIVDDDGPATVAITGDTVPEGTGRDPVASARFLITLSRPAETPLTVSYTADTPGGASSSDDPAGPEDYRAPAGEVTFNPGETVKAVDVPVTADSADETDEMFRVTLSGTGGVAIDPARATATATIVDDDGPEVAVAGVEVPEGNHGAGTAVFTVTLAAASVQPVTVGYATANGTAAGGADYTPTSGTLRFAPGETSHTVAVPVAGDTLAEPDEDFVLGFGTLTGATPAAAGPARAVIGNDDLAQLDIADAGLAEGDSGTALLAFTVTLAPSSPAVVTVAYSSEDGSAVAGQDFTAATGQLTFHPGETVKSVVVPVIADTSEGADETFSIRLSAVSAGARLARGRATGTIIDDDAAPEIFSPDVTAAEGAGPGAAAVFPVRLSGPRSFPVTVRYETRAGTATAGIDFTPVAGSLTFAPGDETRPVEVPIHDDSRFEGRETVRLRLSAAGNGVLDDPEAVATILDDDPPAYLVAGSDGGVFPFGGARFLGSAGHLRLRSPVVGVAAHPSGRGYWMVATDGGIFAFGDSRFFGSTGGRRLNRPIVGMAATPSGNGYWLVSSDGGIFAFGDARFFGSTGGRRLNKPIVGMAATPSGDGYWLVASDGGIFAFGDAAFLGSTGAVVLNRPIVGMAATPSGAGYWLVATDGGIFTFGDAAFFGSTGAVALNRPIVGMAPVPSGEGYWLVATDGGIFAFGDARFNGSTGALRINRPVIGMATL